MDSRGEWTLLFELGRARTYQSVDGGLVRFLRSRECRDSSLAEVQQNIDCWNTIAPSPIVIEPFTFDAMAAFVSVGAEGDELGKSDLRNAAEGGATLVQRFLDVAVATTTALASIHRAGLLHQNIKPSNVFVSASGATLIDPGSAVQLEGLLRDLRSPYVIERVLPYLAPEQTGRMARGVDGRTDLYSLGVVFFELLSGTPPFTSADPLEVIHAHLARRPPPLAHVCPQFPAPIIAIINRLLEKDPERRYRSASGLLHDLEVCSRQWRVSGRIDGFELGRADVPQTLEFEGKLYGREFEQRAIEVALAEACNGRPYVLLLSGPPGIGKSALARLVVRLAHIRNCHVGVGKCDQSGLEQPYFAIREALAEVVDQLLLQPEDVLQRWRVRFEATMAGLGGVIRELCPTFECIVGPQAWLPPLDLAEAKARLRLAAQRLFKVIASCGHPLVLFLDDLQWADSGTLDLLQHSVLADSSLPLLVIGSYRSTEVTENHPVVLTTKAIAASGVSLRSCALRPLSNADIAELLAVSLGRPSTEVTELAEAIQEKTLGNPFFVRVLLTALMAGGVLSFDGLWNWNLEEIRTRQTTENVVDLLCQGMGQLQPETQQVLEYAALFGNSAALSDLVFTLQCDLPELLDWLEPAIAAKLVRLRDGRLVFVHDRIQEAALATVPPDVISARHLEIAEVLRQHLDDQELESRIFEHVSHLNASRSTLPASERIELALLNLRAIEKARSSAAFGTAFELARAGLACLISTDWISEYPLCFDLQRAHAELTFHLGDFAGAEALALSLEQRAQNPIDKASASALLVKLYIVQARFDEAIELAGKALALLDVDLPTAANLVASRFAVERARSEQLLGGREPSELALLGPMRDPAAKLALELLVRVNPAIFFRRPDMLGLNIVLMANLSLEHGHTPVSAFAYAEFGFLCALECEDHGRAYAFTLLGLHLADASLDPIQICRVTHLAAWIQHYTRPLHEADELFHRGFQAGCDAGEMEWAAYHAYGHAARMLLSGTELDATRRELERLREYVQRANSVAIVQLLDALHGQIDFLVQVSKREDHEARTEARLRLWCSGENPQAEFIHRSYRSFSLLLEGRFTEALEHAERALVLQEHAPNHPFVELAHFVRGLASVASLSPGAGLPPSAIDEAQRLDSLAALSPSNYLCRRMLLDAELGRVRHDGWKNGLRYEQAIQQAMNAKLLHEAGLAHRLASRFWLELGQSDFHEVHLRRARACWLRWGARHLAALLDSEARPSEFWSTDAGVRDVFDTRSLIKSSQAISGELDRTQLLSRVMHVILENAGANLGALISPGPNGLEVIISVAADGTEDLTVHPLNDDYWVLSDVVHYTQRTGERVVIADASEDIRLSGNRQVHSRNVRSVLCLPVGPVESMHGVVYLENTLVKGAFTEEHLAVVEVLSRQASISLENAALFARSRRAEATLRSSEEDLRITLDSIGDAVIATDAEGAVLRMNPVGCRLTGWTLDEVRSKPLYDFLQTVDADTLVPSGSLVERVVQTGQRLERSVDTILTSRTGSERRVSESGAPIRDVNGKVVGVVLVFRDVTERHALEERFRQTQKLEALGCLAGGVAHDFNNMLAGILGSAEFLATKLRGKESSELQWGVKTIIDSALRAGDLTKQLLAFSRKGKQVSTLVNVHELIGEALALLERSIDRRIEIERSLGAEVPFVKGDPALLQSALLNLGINARDAMTSGGTLRVSTRTCRLDRADCDAAKGYQLTPGDYVEIGFVDNGCGMSPKVLERIFEPFYTTKPPGKGTGLGLAAVHGTVVAHGGAIQIESSVDQGTRVLLLLPMQESAVIQRPTPAPSRAQSRALSILVID
ncbi:MAG TPA: AAA family ATPase, partial [Polyangiaceae bacterium]